MDLSAAMRSFLGILLIFNTVNNFSASWQCRYLHSKPRQYYQAAGLWHTTQWSLHPVGLSLVLPLPQDSCCHLHPKSPFFEVVPEVLSCPVQYLQLTPDVQSKP